MTHRLTRRRFVQVLTAGAGVATCGSLAGKIFAQSTDLVVLTVKPGPVPTTNDVPEVNATEFDSMGNPSTGSLPVAVLVQSFDVTTGQVQGVTVPQSLPNGAPILQTDEAVTGFTTLANGTLVLTIDPVIGARNETTPTRLTLLGTPPTALIVSGLKPHEQLVDVVGTSDGRLVGLLMKKNGTPPVSLVDIDLGTGAISVDNRIHLPEARRFRALTQWPDGTLYTTAVENRGDTILVQLDLGQKKPIDVVTLNFNGVIWNNGLQSLISTGGSQPQLIAYGAPRYVSLNAIYSVNTSSGAMTKLSDFDSAKATLAHM